MSLAAQTSAHDASASPSEPEVPLSRLCRLASECMGLPGVAVGAYVGQNLHVLAHCGVPTPSLAPLAERNATHAAEDLVPWALDGASGPLCAQTPLYDAEYRVIGAFCVVDVAPTQLDARARRLIRIFARLAEAELRRAALPDEDAGECPLTGLPTRTVALPHLEEMLAKAQAAGTEVALLIADIADFNAINSAFGRQGGDTILALAAHRLASLVPERSYVFRLQGDQFAVALTVEDRAEEVEALITTLATGLDEPLRFGDREVVLHFVFGTAVYPHRAHDRTELIDRAILALREAQHRRTGAEVFTTELEERLVREVAVEQRLRIALAEQKLTVAYQPKVCLSTGAIRSVEALARWRDDELGFVSPVEFIPAAERSGLISELGRQVLERALRDVMRIREYRPDFMVSVNVAPPQLQRETYVQEVLAAFEVTGATYDALELEVVETSLVENIDRVVAIIGQLRNRGVAFAIDDFGTGYSSLSYLRRLPVQTLKLDRAFINEITKSQRDSALVESIVSMAHVLDFEVVAEGVETEVQASILREFLCDTGQGYLWAKPAPIEDVLASLTAT